MMELGRVLRDLQGRAPIPHRMVRGHDALVLHTQASGEGRLTHAMQAGPGSVAHPSPACYAGGEPARSGTD